MTSEPVVSPFTGQQRTSLPPAGVHLLKARPAPTNYRTIGSLFRLRPGRAANVIMALAVATSAWAGVNFDDPVNSWAPPWAALATTVVGWALCWPHRQLPSLAQLTRLGGAFFLAFLAGALLAGASWQSAAWMSAMNLVVSLALAWSYRRLNSIDDWAPGKATDVVMLCLLGALAAFVLMLLGGVPAGARVVFDYPANLDWLSRTGGGTVTGLPFGLLVFVSERPSATRAQFTLGMVLLAALGAVCSFLPYLVPEYPLSWAMFIPALWLGLTCPPRPVALLAAVGPVIGLLSTLAPYWRTPTDFGLPPYLHMQILQFVSASVALLICYQREDKARLSRELQARRAQAAADNTILDGVFRAMHDGVLVVDADGVVVMTNAAARDMLSLTPLGAGGSLELIRPHLLCPEGLGPADRGEVDRFLAENRQPISLHVSVPSDNNTGLRNLGLTSRPIVLANRPHRVILLRDTSALQERQYRLKAFARAVAQDLSEPLEALCHAIGATQDLLWSAAPGAAAALSRTIDSTSQIRALIDDHIAATLAREGVVRPTAIELAPLVSHVAWSSDQDELALDVHAPHSVLADPSLAKQLVSNLILDAVEHAVEGQRTAVQVVSERDAEDDWVRVTFAERSPRIRSRLDTPPSCTPSQHPAAGQPHIRSARSAPLAAPSPLVVNGSFVAGPRLHVCCTIVTRHGGQIAAYTNDSGGQTITFTLPAA